MNIDITIPGTFNNPKPNVTKPITKAAMTTPIILPEPPKMLTPPSTTMVTISNSIPKAIEGLVEPNREVKHIAAMPYINPVNKNSKNLTLWTLIPEKKAPV